MTSVAYRMDIKQLRDLDGRFASAEQALLSKRRDELRREGRRLVQLMRAEAPKRSGAFAKGIRFQTRESGHGLKLTVSTPQPLGTWIIKGTRAHPIPRTPLPKGRALRWFGGTSIPGMGIEPSGIGSQAIFARSVNHPGTAPNRFHGRAVRRWKPGAKGTLRKISRSYVDALRRK